MLHNGCGGVIAWGEFLELPKRKIPYRVLFAYFFFSKILAEKGGLGFACH